MTSAMHNAPAGNSWSPKAFDPENVSAETQAFVEKFEAAFRGAPAPRQLDAKLVGLGPRIGEGHF